ncbi:MAG: hypothetical protein JNL89_19300 [Rhodanobacteraceae bacterium]|jgi:hypothetical protein|nr:hypothetical protein [Rhodanobacteraceae bacterium]
MRICVQMLLCAILSLGLVACGGGGATIRASGQTCGQELNDLKSAFETGAISKKEYARLRDATIKRCQRTK